jgi:hypothetical protein
MLSLEDAWRLFGFCCFGSDGAKLRCGVALEALAFLHAHRIMRQQPNPRAECGASGGDAGERSATGLCCGKRRDLAKVLVERGERKLDDRCQGEWLVHGGLPWSTPGWLP